jgi:biopolymer transport protein ExbB/TolQ
MDSTAFTQLGIALAATAAAIFAFNALVGRGPRGTVWIIAACLFTWGAVLPIVGRDPDDLSLSRELQLVVSALQLCGIIGFVLGVVDLLHQRTTDKRHAIAEWALRQPLLWGVVICADFFALLYHGTIDSPLLWRYMAGHPVEVIEAAFFFIGMAILAIRLADLIGQRQSVACTSLGPIPTGGQCTSDCDQLLSRLAELPSRLQQTYLVKRLREALQFVRRKGSAESLDQQLRHLEELDAIEMHGGYATLRIIIWAIPILGFLGTVIGITVAIASLSPEALEQSMSEVTQGLGVAFDTTAEALALTMILMFTKALVEKVENRLLGEVNAQVAQELTGRFQEVIVDHDPNVAVIRRMSEQVLEAVEALAARQAEAWKSSIDETHQQWAAATVATGHVVRDSLAASIKDGLEVQAKAFNDGVLKLADRLTSSTAHHADKLAANTAQHADRLSASTAQHADRLVKSAAEHAAQLDRMDHSAQETVGRLREGLEKLAELLVEALHRHGEVLTASEKELAEGNRQHLTEVEAALGQAMVTAADRQEQLVRQSEHLLKEMQIALVEAAGASVQQQEQLIRQGDVLLKVVDATGQIKMLEAVLNKNLAAVNKAHSFEEMAINLSAAIQLLSARLGPRALYATDSDAAGEDASQAA